MTLKDITRGRVVPEKAAEALLLLATDPGEAARQISLLTVPISLVPGEVSQGLPQGCVVGLRQDRRYFSSNHFIRASLTVYVNSPRGAVAVSAVKFVPKHSGRGHV